MNVRNYLVMILPLLKWIAKKTETKLDDKLVEIIEALATGDDAKITLAHSTLKNEGMIEA